VGGSVVWGLFLFKESDMATQGQKIHPSKKKADPIKTRTGKDKLKALSIKKLYELLDKIVEPGKKRAKIAKEIARREIK